MIVHKSDKLTIAVHDIVVWTLALLMFLIAVVGLIRILLYLIRSVINF